MNDPQVNIDIDVNLLNNIYPDRNGNQSSESYHFPKFNKLSMNSNTYLLQLNFNIRLLCANFDTFNCFTNLLYKKIDILSFSESILNYNNKNLYTIEGYCGMCTFNKHICARLLFYCISAYVRVYLHAATSVVAPLLAFQARTFQNTLGVLGDNIVLLLTFTCTSTNIRTGDEVNFVQL